VKHGQAHPPQEKGKSPAPPAGPVGNGGKDPVRALFVWREKEQGDTYANGCKDCIPVSRRWQHRQCFLTVDRREPQYNAMKPVGRKRANGAKHAENEGSQQHNLVWFSVARQWLTAECSVDFSRLEC